MNEDRRKVKLLRVTIKIVDYKLLCPTIVVLVQK